MSAPASTQSQPLRGMPNVLSSANAAQPLTEAQGRAVLIRFAAGDAAALNLLTPIVGPDQIAVHAQRVAQAQQPVPHGADPVIQGREFGLVVERDGTNEAHLVLGQMNPQYPSMGAMVAFAPFITRCHCVAHLHPLITPIAPDGRRIQVHKWADRGGKATSFAAIVGRPGAYGTYLPTAGDAGFAIAQGLAAHTVYTPYRIQGGGANRTLEAPEISPNDPLLSWEIINATETAAVYQGSLAARADGVTFWSTDFTIKRSAAMDDPVITGFTFTNSVYSG
jgi:hypothetical protein